MAEDFSIRAVGEAEQMIAEGEFELALDRLKTAAESVPWWWDAGQAGAVTTRIQQLADRVARDDPSYAPHALLISDIVAGRGAGSRASGDEPWYYGVAEAMAFVALLVSALSALGGIVIGIVASKYTGLDGQTNHHAGVVILGIAGGVLSAAGWLGAAAALNLLLDIGRTLRASGQTASDARR